MVSTPAFPFSVSSARTAIDRVIAIATGDRIDTGISIQGVVAGTAIDGIVARAAAYGIISVQTSNGVVALQATDLIVRIRAGQYIVACCSDDDAMISAPFA